MITLRPVSLQDLRELLRWISSEAELRCWSGPGFDWPLNLDQLQEYHQEITSGRRLAWSAVSDGEGGLVGHASLALKAEGRVGRLGRVLVHPARRGAGVGRAVVSAVVTAGFEQTLIDTMTLGVYPQNAAARRLYESLGFVATETRTGAIRVAGQSWDSVEMQLPRPG